MVRIVAVDWDRREARCVVASAAAGRLRIVSARSAPLVDVAEGGESHPDLAGSVRAVLDEAKAGRAVALVGVERASVELIPLSLPPAKPSELPALVAMQVARESHAADEDAVVDFVPLAEGGEPGRPEEAAAQPCQVTAAVLPGSQLKRIQAECRRAGLAPSRLLLRSFAAASLFARRVSPEERGSLVVNLLCEEADLLVVVDGRLVFQRTVRLPEGAAEEAIARRLAAEIHRTLVVAQQAAGSGAAVERVYVFGTAEADQRLAEALGSELPLPLSLVDPFEITDIPEDGTPEHAGRFAGLLGMILDESFGSHAVDFLHPRQPPRPVDRRRVVLAVASLVALAVAGVGYYVWDEIAAADREIRNLSAELREKNELLKRTARQEHLINAVREWKAGEIVWLDELRELSQRFPPARDLIVLRMSIVSERSGGGAIDFTGMVRQPLVVARMEQAMRDPYHEVRSRRIQQRDQGKGYSWIFETSMSVAGRDKSSYVEQQAAAP